MLLIPQVCKLETNCDTSLRMRNRCIIFPDLFNVAAASHANTMSLFNNKSPNAGTTGSMATLPSFSSVELTYLLPKLRLSRNPTKAQKAQMRSQKIIPKNAGTLIYDQQAQDVRAQVKIKMNCGHCESMVADRASLYLEI